MTIRQIALQNLLQIHADIKKNGLNEVLRVAGKGEFKEYTAGFIPAASRWDKKNETIYLYEIETTANIPSSKLSAIQLFGHDIYDEAGCYTQLWITDRYGMNPHKIWDVKDEICWTYEPTGEWLSESEIEKREKK
jgi:hypothetical protein